MTRGVPSISLTRFTRQVASTWLLIFATVTAVASALGAFPDTPYNEVISSRFTCNDGSEAVNGWGVTPFPGVPSQVEARYSPLGFVLVANNTVWSATLPVQRSAATEGMTSTNASLWLYPVQWAAVQGLSINSDVDRIVVDSQYPGTSHHGLTYRPCVCA